MYIYIHIYINIYCIYIYIYIYTSGNVCVCWSCWGMKNQWTGTIFCLETRQHSSTPCWLHAGNAASRPAKRSLELRCDFINHCGGIL